MLYSVESAVDEVNVDVVGDVPDSSSDGLVQGSEAEGLEVLVFCGFFLFFVVSDGLDHLRSINIGERQAEDNKRSCQSI